MNDTTPSPERELPPVNGGVTTVEEQSIKENKTKLQRGYPFVAVAIAVAIVWGMSYIPWSKYTNNHAKDFNLFADLFPKDSTTAVVAGNEPVDPELAHELEILSEISPDLHEAEASAIDEESEQIESGHEIVPMPYFDPRIDGKMVIEDYTRDRRGLGRLKAALGSERPARIAVIGDSYIEGDIFTQDLRDLLQTRFGGRGVGYVPPHSIVSGFRRTVNIKGSGWSQHGIQKSNGGVYPTIVGEYFTSQSGMSTTAYAANDKDPRLAAWSSSSLLFVAPDSGTITLRIDGVDKQYDINPSDEVQSLTLRGETTSFKIETEIPRLVFLGAWLEDQKGVVVDCMSMRGVSGVANRKLKPELAAQMRRHIDYDLIIVEYGINALNSEENNYSGYGQLMKMSIDRLRQCYPNADILMMGIGDRGQKVDGEVHSLPTATAMVTAQRKAARDASCLFWDTREAMGGVDAIVSWRERRLVNGDYIHLNAAGGKVLADMLVESMYRMMEL